MKYHYNLEEVKIAIQSSVSFVEVLRKLNVPINGGNQSTIKQLIKKNNLDVSHFYILYLSKVKRNFNRLEKSDALKRYKIYNKSEPVDFGSLKRFCVKYNLIKYECERCRNDGKWNDTTLVLQMDHINGDKLDNRLENLRFLCPNCHSQTDTFSGKNFNFVKINENQIYEDYMRSDNKREFFTELRKKTSLKECKRVRNHVIEKIKNTQNLVFNGTAKNKSNEWKSKIGFSNRKVKNRPSIEELSLMIEMNPITHIAKKYDVSDNAVRKWCKVYGIKMKSNKYWASLREAIV